MMPVPSRMREVRAAMKGERRHGIVAPGLRRPDAVDAEALRLHDMALATGQSSLASRREMATRIRSQSRTTRSWRDRFIARAPALVISSVFLIASPIEPIS